MAQRAVAARERAECRGQNIAVERLGNIVIRGVARRAVEAEQRQRQGRQAAAPAEDRAQIVGARLDKISTRPAWYHRSSTELYVPEANLPVAKDLVIYRTDCAPASSPSLDSSTALR